MDSENGYALRRSFAEEVAHTFASSRFPWSQGSHAATVDPPSMLRRADTPMGGLPDVALPLGSISPPESPTYIVNLSPAAESMGSR